MGAALLAAGGAAQAASITVPNNSFELPDAHTPFGVSTAITNWTTYGDAPFDTGGGPNSSGTGIFPNVNPDNSVNFTNADGAQVAYIFTKSSIPTNRDGLEQILPTTYQAGQAYTLQIAVGLAGGAPGATEPFTFALFTFDPANPGASGSPGARNILASRTIFNDATTPLSQTVLTNLALTTPILAANDPAVGKQIGIEIFTALGSDVTVTAGRQYDFDNVRLSSDVPEPGLIGATVAGGIGMMLGRRRRRA
jgi:hypothetical protein